MSQNRSNHTKIEATRGTDNTSNIDFIQRRFTSPETFSPLYRAVLFLRRIEVDRLLDGADPRIHR
jgi:hypothetical protein